MASRSVLLSFSQQLFGSISLALPLGNVFLGLHPTGGITLSPRDMTNLNVSHTPCRQRKVGGRLRARQIFMPPGALPFVVDGGAGRFCRWFHGLGFIRLCCYNSASYWPDSGSPFNGAGSRPSCIHLAGMS